MSFCQDFQGYDVRREMQALKESIDGLIIKWVYVHALSSTVTLRLLKYHLK